MLRRPQRPDITLLATACARCAQENPGELDIALPATTETTEHPRACPGRPSGARYHFTGHHLCSPPRPQSILGGAQESRRLRRNKASLYRPLELGHHPVATRAPSDVPVLPTAATEQSILGSAQDIPEEQDITLPATTCAPRGSHKVS